MAGAKINIGATVVVWNGIPALLVAVEANERAAVKSTADAIANDARARAPVATGFLRGSIHADTVEAGKEAVVSVDASYGAYVEYGTYKMAAQPYLAPAVEAHRNEFFEKCGRGAVKF
jgi:HK97 gp10 family phage protein